MTMHPSLFLEDLTSDQLRAELRRRDDLYRQGLCPYCRHDLAAHTCKYASAEKLLQWHRPTNKDDA